MKPVKFRKKPVVIDAIQFSENNRTAVLNFIRCYKCADRDDKGNSVIRIKTLEGLMTATIGDWIIQGVKGEFYPCKNDIFEATYERVDL